LWNFLYPLAARADHRHPHQPLAAGHFFLAFFASALTAGARGD
jgi:hypothetical protein